MIIMFRAGRECDAGEYVDRFARALYDAETLSRLPQDELRDVFDRYCY